MDRPDGKATELRPCPQGNGFNAELERDNEDRIMTELSVRTVAPAGKKRGEALSERTSSFDTRPGKDRGAVPEEPELACDQNPLFHSINMIRTTRSGRCAGPQSN